MPPRLRSRLLLLALGAALAGAGAVPAGAVVDEAHRGPRGEAAVPEPEPESPSAGEQVAKVALQAVGIPYRWGGESPATGFDCSGLVRWAYAQIRVDLPHSSYALYGRGRRVPLSDLAPGDILFFDGLGHVGLYAGRGRMVHAPQTGRTVEIVRLQGSSYGLRLVGARRVVPA